MGRSLSSVGSGGAGDRPVVRRDEGAVGRVVKERQSHARVTGGALVAICRFFAECPIRFPRPPRINYKARSSGRNAMAIFKDLFPAKRRDHGDHHGHGDDSSHGRDESSMNGHHGRGHDHGEGRHSDHGR
ncbi:hypothetical protein GCM10010508_10310 [Streptomyces naganishii JCM 4654]|uniref:Uncharacterized protein n=2 Tax=Streptomyces naganishii TaxID=285447 RepID=A0A918Y0C4_9ACTN|nr:hypothetical protein GCM10010508_10310 [Streptomyces naganishii JCM 4654]